MKRLVYAAAVIIVLVVLFAFWAYQQVYGFALKLEDERLELVVDQDVRDINDLQSLLRPHLRSPKAFKRVAAWMRVENVRPGYYLLDKELKNVELVRILRGGMQTPVQIGFVKERTRSGLAGMLCSRLAADSVAFLRLLNNDSTSQALGFSKDELLGMFIPNTYEMWWTTDEEALLKRIHKEYKSFWNESRKQKAEKLGLTPKEVSVLASIVEEETNKVDEKSRVAGVYLNRIRKSWPLEADPTLKFALGDFSIKRVLNIHKEVESPYNTYKNGGLPPGPICTPSISSLEAVLNAEEHQYMFFCARPDFSGYHNFAVTLRQHNINARNYQDALNRLNIK